jgi:pimeloyl-ACP methyl ester carboxylesterase
MIDTLNVRRTAVRLATGAFAFVAGAAVLSSPLRASAQAAKPSIVLVHGAWADASSWNGVIKPLTAAGYAVYAPPNPLRGLSSDAAALSALLKSVSGPVILVGHSYGGAVTSVASSSNTRIKALVYVDAFVPDAGDSCLSLLAGGPPPPKDLFTPVPFPTATGGDADLYLTPKYFGAVFASDVPAPIAQTMSVTQRPVTVSALNEKAPAAEGWKTIPSWFVIGDLDNVIPPAKQLFMAQRAKAHVSHVRGSHPSMIQHPEATVAAIMAAIAATKE